MHYMHNVMLRNLENDRVAREVELHFQQLRDAGIEPGTSGNSFLSWLSRPQRGRVETRAVRHPRPTHRPRPV